MRRKCAIPKGGIVLKRERRLEIHSEFSTNNEGKTRSKESVPNANANVAQRRQSRQ